MISARTVSLDSRLRGNDGAGFGVIHATYFAWIPACAGMTAKE
ncbi:MAG: hypothetical protein P1P81_10775 [Desulfobulbales bacterium]|nr:hypothetical protein [Desulfobulbales bacterium]